MTDSNYSLSDIASVTRGDYADGFGGGAWWIIILFLLVGGNGFGWGNRMMGESIATTGDVQRGFDTNSILNKLNGIENGLCDGFYSQNTTMLNGFCQAQNTMAQGFAGLNTEILKANYATTGAVKDVGFQIQDVGCRTNHNIDSVKFENAQNTCKITTAIHQEAEETRRMIAQQETQRLRDELAQARDIINNTAQSRYVLDSIGRYVTNPPCPPVVYSGCGCNCSTMG